MLVIVLDLRGVGLKVGPLTIVDIERGGLLLIVEEGASFRLVSGLFTEIFFFLFNFLAIGWARKALLCKTLLRL